MTGNYTVNDLHGIPVNMDLLTHSKRRRRNR
jgi:hypothetical protein